MTKRLMTLIVVSGLFFSGVNAADDVQKVAKCSQCNDAPMLILDSIKTLTQVIKPEQAAFFYIKFYKEAVDNALEIVEKTIAYRNRNIHYPLPEQYTFIVESMKVCEQEFLRLKMGSFNLAIMQQVLPAYIREECEIGIGRAGQKFLNQHYANRFPIDDWHPAGLPSEAKDFLYATIYWQVAVLEKYFIIIDRSALGLELGCDGGFRESIWEDTLAY